MSGLGLVGLLASGEALGQTANLEVMATVEASCTMHGASLIFGTYRSEETETAQATIVYDCPADLSISLMLSAGQHPQGGGRAMVRDGGGELLSYGLYQDPARSQDWGDQGEARIVNPTIDGDANVEVYGQIEAGQSVPAGNYRDTVLITLVID
jgi:spore coat protein U-like protein